MQLNPPSYTPYDFRKFLLLNSDWTQLPDSPLSAEKKAEWAAYRQALRDLSPPDQFVGIPFEFPDTPSK